MAHAASTGAINFREADFLDRRWWLKLGWVIQQVDSQLAVKVYDMQLLQTYSLLQTAEDSEKYNKQLEQLQLLTNRWLGTVLPWQGSAEDANATMFKSLRAEYVRRFGDPQDPAYRARLLALVEHWRSRRHARTSR